MDEKKAFKCDLKRLGSWNGGGILFKYVGLERLECAASIDIEIP